MAEHDYRHTYSVTFPVKVQQHHSGVPHSEEDTGEYDQEITVEIKASHHCEVVELVRQMFEKLLPPV